MGETSRYTAAVHLRAIAEDAGVNLLDLVILNMRPPSSKLQSRYAAERAEPVANDLEAIEAMGVKPVLADLLVEDRSPATIQTSLPSFSLT